jgi:hypothetical protein
LLKVNSDFYLNQLEGDLKEFSTGDLKEFLNKTDLTKENINSANELLNFILSRINDKEISDELITVFSEIASKNLLKADAFKPRVKKGIQLSAFMIGLFSVFFVLLVAILAFAFRRNKKES